ncbi:DUF2075 domain-containing protein [Fructobacillus fructosus]|uniref:DUF2075 domain-containing protein n=1 Tax=Fructobacillus fructosus TaxID=1631 RepID=UPI00021958F2|nr:DUF2075 domain-containing protein [Fructobacillus fructosus]MBC9119236.1 DUF2075 domain-containing protein [Fructobacillus fructosus]MBD9366530.1 DUF2075 domain-containing protein [Leuconostoc mesenteroides]GAP01006.1 hypothetical protein FFRU_030500 [Fructobacillus fructosus]CAK1249267.1 DUF2075 family (BH3996) [Fructobacillus fructosus]
MVSESAIVRSTKYGRNIFPDLEESAEIHSLIFKYPTVYIVNDKEGQGRGLFDVYVGETNDIKNRTNQHLQDTRDDWKKFGESGTAELIVMGHPHFNKSLTLDIENKMRLYMTGVESVNHLNNRRGNPQGDYYTSNEVDTVFDELWIELHNLNKKLFPNRAEVEQSAMFKSSPFHRLTEEQIENKNYLMLNIRKAMKESLSQQLMIVEGAAGTGKTVLLSSLFFDFLAENIGEDGRLKKRVALLVNHDEQVKVYRSIGAKLGIKDINDVVMKPNPFINRYHDKMDEFDAVIVDEGHLLANRNGQAFKKAYGKTHLEAIRKIARVTVLVYDPYQVLKTEQRLPQKQLDELRQEVKEAGHLLTLHHQMRINAQQQTIDWLDDLIHKHQVNPIPKDSKYDLKVFDSATALDSAIRLKAKQEDSELSRVLATYDWEWKPDGREYKVTDGNFSKPWNYYLTNQNEHVSWAENPKSIDEVGSTFTIQGFDLNYAGVIIGESVQYRGGKIVFNPKNSFSKKATNKMGESSGATPEERLSARIKNLNNELNVLLSRGVNGLYIYAVDPELQAVLMKAYANKNMD